MVAAQLGAGHDGVAVPVHLETWQGPQRLLDQIGQGALAATDARDIDQRGGQVDRIGGEVQRRHGATPCSRSTSFRTSLSCSCPGSR